MYASKAAFVFHVRQIVLLVAAVVVTALTAYGQKAPAEVTKLVLHAPQAVINPGTAHTFLAQVDVGAYREIRVSARGPADRGVLIGVFVVEGETAVLLEKILLEPVSLGPDSQEGDINYGSTNRASKVIDFPGKTLRITGLASNPRDGTNAGATVDLIIHGR